MNPNHEREKIVNIEERIPKIKEQRKQKANRRLISFIVLFYDGADHRVLADADQQSVFCHRFRKRKRVCKRDQRAF